MTKQKMKQTEMVLTNIYYPPQSKNSISLRGWRRNKTFPGSAFGSSLCTSQNQRNPSFSWPAIPLETELQPQGGSKGKKEIIFFFFSFFLFENYFFLLGNSFFLLGNSFFFLLGNSFFYVTKNLS